MNGESSNPGVRMAFDGTFIDRSGTDIVKHFTLPKYSFIIAYRSFLNPLDYDGSSWRSLQDGYKTNELGFGICMLFILAVSQSFMSYRKYSLLE